MKRALITGITGQDGSHLTDLLLDHGYEVWGLARRAISTELESGRSTHDRERARRLHLRFGDVTDAASVDALFEHTRFDEVYHLAAQSRVGCSFQVPELTAQVTALGTCRLLEAIRRVHVRTGRSPRFYQAGSSEMFGDQPAPHHEQTPRSPVSPYGAAKAYAHDLTCMYRRAYGLFASNGMLFNHEGPRRAECFVTRKVSRAVGRIKHGLQSELRLGNLEARRDWGLASDYVEAMWRMLQADEPDDFVVGTGQSHSVRELVERAFALADLDYRDFVTFDPTHVRPIEIPELRADASKARRVLGWAPRHDFSDVVRIMVDHDLELAAREKHARG